MYATIDLDSRLILNVAVFDRHGTDPAAAFLHDLNEKYNLLDAVFLVDGYGYLTALARIGLSGRLNYVERNQIEKWFQTLKMRIDRSIIHGRAVGRASAGGLQYSCSTIIVIDRIKLSTNKLQRWR